MNASLALRLVLDSAAAAALLAALAYYWLDNAAHEWIGSGLFVLLAAHNIFHRRWYGAVQRKQRDLSGMLNVALTLLLLMAMLALLVSGLLVSQTLFSFAALDDGVTARQVHRLAAHWTVLLVGMHLGLRWPIVMGALRKGCKLEAASRTRTLMLRMFALGIAVHGVFASFEMLVGSKLLMMPVLDMWDFNESTPRFFLNQVSIIGLYAAMTHYTMRWLQRVGRAGSAAGRTSSSAI